MRRSPTHPVDFAIKREDNREPGQGYPSDYETSRNEEKRLDNTIVDFDPAEDVIDLSRVLSGFVGGASDPAQFLRLVAGPAMDHTALQVDFDGGGNNFIDFITLLGSIGSSVGDLVGSGAIDLVA